MLPNDVKKLIKGKIREFMMSKAKVYCQTCGVTFYSGFAFGVMEESDVIWDFRYLAFRHAWDNPDHIVVVYLPFIAEHSKPKHDGIFNYSEIVEKLRQRMRDAGDPRGWRKADENWNENEDRIMCSVCKKIYNNVRQACLCCINEKPWLPLSELEGLK